MTQALHIFRKDVRRLWVPLATVFALQALFVFFEMRADGPTERIGYAVWTPDGLVTFLLPVAWWVLVLSLVHGEPLPGNRQFWVTRPYRWKSLLASKILFILIFINLPILIADCLILTAQGFSLSGNWPGLLWKQVPFTIVALVPPLPIASLTRNLGQAIVVLLLILLRIVVGSIPVGSHLPSGDTGVSWTADVVTAASMIAIFGAVIWIQYRMRRTRIAGALFAAFVLIPGWSIPVSWQLAWHARVRPPQIDTSTIRIAFDPDRHRLWHGAQQQQMAVVNVALPVKVSGAPEGVSLVSNLAEVTIAGHAAGASLGQFQNAYWETLIVPADLYRALRGRPVNIRVKPVITAVRQTEFRIPLKTGSVHVPGFGTCESREPYPSSLEIVCRWAFLTPPFTRIHADYPGWDTPDPSERPPREQSFGARSDSPWPAELSLSPVHRMNVFMIGAEELARAKAFLTPAPQIVFRSDHPIAHFETAFEIRGVKLDYYAVTKLPE